MAVDVNRIYGNIVNIGLVDLLTIHNERIFWIRHGLTILRQLTVVKGVLSNVYYLRGIDNENQ